jgi:hypothetical protein
VEKVGTNYTKQKPDIGGAKPSSIRAKFENMAKEKEQVRFTVIVIISLLMLLLRLKFFVGI